MLAVKIHQEKDERTSEFDKTINNISEYICKELNLKDTKVLSDNHCIEIIAGKEAGVSSDEIVAELVIRKTVVINKEAFKDRAELDRYITNIKHFCNQAKEVEESIYLPLHMR